MRKVGTLAAVAVAGIIAALLGLELFLRATASVDAVYEQIQSYPEIASAGWARVFLEQYQQLEANHTLGKGLRGDVHHPLLGWDTRGGIRGKVAGRNGSAGRFRVVVVGDSFAYGDEVADDETFPAFLEQALPNAEVLNLGVRAFGVGQSYLKLATAGMEYHPDLVIFAVYGPDYFRTVLSFYRFAKPVFDVAPDRLNVQVKNVPVPDREGVYLSLRSRLGPLSWALAFFRQALLQSATWEAWTRHEELYRWRTDYVHELLLRDSLNLVRRSGGEILFVYVPDAREFVPPVRRVGWLRQTFRRLFRRVGADYVDLTDELAALHGRKAVRRDDYTWNDGVPGHFSPQGNRAVAEILAQRVLRMRWPSSPVGAIP